MIDGGVIGGTEVVARFNSMPTNLREELRIVVGQLAFKLENKVKGKLNGEVLKRRTGLLRRSINDRVIAEGDSVTGIVSTAVVYARAHEYGFDGMVSVRAHLRTIKQAFGRAISPVTFPVAAHSMHMKLPEKSFLRSSLREMEASGAIRDAMVKAIGKATV